METETTAAQMSKEIGPFLRLATEELLDSSLFSDLTIICGDTYHQVHKVVLYAHGGKFREIAESAHAAITLNDKKPAVLDAVIQYLYRLDFAAPQGYELDEFLFAANVYFMAMKYGVRGLPQLALEKFAEACGPEEDLDPFVRAVRFAQEQMADGDDEFWRALSRIAEAQFDFLEEQRESGELCDRDQKTLDNLLGNVHPREHLGSQEGSNDIEDGGADDHHSTPTDEQKPGIESSVPETRSYVPPHRRYQHPVAVQQGEGELQKKHGPGQLNAAASAFVPSFASPAHKEEAEEESQQSTHQKEQDQTDNRTPPPRMADHEKWKDEPDQWTDPAISSPPAEERNYGLTNSPHNNGGCTTTEDSSEPRAARDSFQGPGQTLGASAPRQAGREENAKASRLLNLGKTKTSSPAFNVKYGPGA
ncbi:hypothetical protein TI39_contig4211g00012 [Zymoseptoria brevis]|uniref:BTB domain-containing protein n=1 Tax=Zymoseptoria brevis TaxID=1047168 RepID=A0A0F4G9X3_9PEZI|nr:hypothetical protein TI39_contig4211g00012 [Zymoseptoria brevis]